MERKLCIKNFVQDVLGCTCPDKVFEQIEERTDASSNPHTRSITIGGRLLIYVWEVCESTGFEAGLSALLKAGRHERDARGLNRFRAVLVVEDTQSITTQATLLFSQFGNRDERMHIHVISRDALKGI